MRYLRHLILSLFLVHVNVNAFSPPENSLDLFIQRSASSHQNKKKTTANHLYNFNNFEAATTIVGGSSIPFNGTPIQSGAISQTSIDEFTIIESGHYFINVVADAFFPTVNSGIILELNGSAVDPGTPVNYFDTPHIIQQIVPITASKCDPVILKVFVIGERLNFPSGPAASITIIQLSE